MEVQVRDSASRFSGTMNTLLLYYLGIILLVSKNRGEPSNTTWSTWLMPPSPTLVCMATPREPVAVFSRVWSTRRRLHVR